MKIVALDGQTLNPGDNSWDPIASLGHLVVHSRSSTSQIPARMAGADIVITNKATLSAETIAAVPTLRFIAVTATGYNMVDTAAAKARNILVSNVPEYGTQSVAQFTIALLLELAHHIGLHNRAVHEGEWTKCRDFAFWKTPQIELAGLTLGIVGFGRIGRAVGEIAHALGMRIIATGQGKSPPTYSPFEFVDLQTLFQQSDAVTLHCPLATTNAQMVNADLLSKMKPSAFLINTARGGLINEPDLAQALKSNQIAGAAVDVVSTEPIPAAHPLLNIPNCIITPHMAWGSVAARKRLMHSTAKNIAAFQANSPINVVNP